MLWSKAAQSLVASFMVTWKSTCPSGNTVLNMDSVWVPLQLPPQPCQSLNQCQRLHVEIHVTECFCNDTRVEGDSPWKCSMITRQTQTVALTLTAQNYCFRNGWRVRRSKMWNSGGCLCVCLSLWKHRNVSLIELLHVCGSAICAAESIITGETGLSWDSAGTFHHLRVMGQAIAAATVCFSLLKYKL